MATSIARHTDAVEMSTRPSTYPADSGGRSSLASDAPEVPVNAQQLPPVDGGRQAWLFCFASFVLEILVWGFGFSYGIFQAYYTSHPPFQNKSAIAIGSVGQTALAIEYTEGIFLSFVLGRYPELLRPMMWAGLILASGSLLLSSFVSQIELLILLQGVCLGIGSGMLWWPGVLLIPDWFSRRRGLATGIIFAGSGIGGFILPLIVNALLDAVDFRWALRVWAAIMLVLGGLAILGVRRRTPAPRYRPGQQRPRLVPRNIQFFKGPLFWFWSLSTLLQAMAYFPVSLYISVFTTSIASPLSATIVLSLFNSAGVVGQVLMGYLADRMPYTYIMAVSTFASAIAAFLLWGFADTLGRVFAFAIVFGGLSGGFSSVNSAVSLDVVGPNPEQASMALSAVSPAKGLAAIIGPILSGVLLEAGKSSALGGKYGKFGFGPVELIATKVKALKVLDALNH
ncbi:hypothetical protein EIP91_002002 [Steccherinum ochraceum]|uniref:Major facilitator superfamily (MFS) profile domain-containing protein n=1 Tax=Steccherinum ochraceum TaxID=92696 RepID=A0A4R0RTP4_9APHY|nr:hypothetical protein EIP91_002002 [Steccherinum ochraceum]